MLTIQNTYKFLSSDYFQKLLKKCENPNILYKLIKQFGNNNPNLSFDVFIAITYFKRTSEPKYCHTIPTIAYVKAKRLWNEFINNYSTLSHELKEKYMIDDDFY